MTYMNQIYQGQDLTAILIILVQSLILFLIQQYTDIP